RAIDPDLSATLTDLAAGRTTVAANSLKGYIDEVIADATNAAQFSAEIDDAAAEARNETGSAEAPGTPDRPRGENSERSGTPEAEEVTPPAVPTARVVSPDHVP